MEASGGCILLISVCLLRARFVNCSLPLLILAVGVWGSAHGGRGEEKTVYNAVLGG